MATAGSIIRRALRLATVIGEGETPTAQEYADALEALNAMLDGWRTERLMTYAVKSSDFTVTGAQSYAIGPSQTFNTTTPVRIESATFRRNGLDDPVEVIGKAQYIAITDKATTGDVVESVYYEQGAPNGTVFVYPVVSSGTLTLNLWQPFAGYANVADAVTLPPGYERAIAYNLAVEIAPEFDREAPATVVAIATQSKRQLKAINSPLPVAVSEVSLLGRRTTSDIQRGY